MSAQHTTGPWKRRKGFSSGTTEIYANNPNVKKPFRPCDFAVVESDTKEGRANARLIAAAPDLLDALDRLRNAEKAPREEWLAALLNADAAIAKAKGEQL